jgi:sugar-specific transcriptional regulator TrmB
MDHALILSLRHLGCNDKHVRFYRANLQLGAATLMEIAKNARLQRSTAYVIATEMVALGLVQEDHKTYKKLFTAAEPDYLLQRLQAKHRSLGRSTLALKEALPELRAAHQTTTTRPRVRTFEGRAGLTAVWQDILAEQQEILLWTNQHTESLVFGADTHDLFINERIDKNIPIRVLAVANAEGRQLRRNDATTLPQGVTFTSETYIYGDKIAVLDIGKTIFGVITENQQIAATQRTIFELNWQQR